MENLQTRLLTIISRMGLTKAQFEKQAGLSNGFVDKAGDNTRKSSLDKISTAFPQINTNWLLTGEGQMLRDQFMGSSINIGNITNSVAGNNSNNVNTRINDNTESNALKVKVAKLEADNKHLQSEVEHLKEIVSEKDARIKEKERTIGILMKTN